MPDKDIIAISNALTDVIISATDEEIERLDSGKFPFEDLEEIVEFSNRDVKIIPGGSPANVVANASYLGAKCGLICTLGEKDEIGDKYREDLAKNNIEDLSHGIPFEHSGICYTLISSSGERHFSTRMGASSKFFVEDIERKKILEYKLLHTSGYELKTDKEAVLNAIKLAKDNRKIISFDLADEKVVGNAIGKTINDSLTALSLADILFANEKEAGELGEDYIKDIAGKSNIFVKKLGEKGSKIYYKGNECEIPIYECKKLNTNGAGDAYAAGFLVNYLKMGGSTHDLSFKEVIECGHRGSKLASQVCEMPGARLSKPKSNLDANNYEFFMRNRG